MENLKNWYLTPLKKYAVFSGRASRTEYWTFILLNMAIGFVIAFSATIVGRLAALFHLLFNLFIIIPQLSVVVRRLHDTNKSALWLLLIFLPFIGPFILFIFMFLRSDLGKNKYGKVASKPIK